MNDGAYLSGPPAPFDIMRALHEGLEIVSDLNGKLQELDRLILTGVPTQIADAAAMIEIALAAASPAFSRIATTMHQLGVVNLAAAAAQLRLEERSDAAGLADALRLALKRFANRSVESGRRARHLNRGVNTALRSLQALGIQETGRLIAEA